MDSSDEYSNNQIENNETDQNTVSEELKKISNDDLIDLVVQIRNLDDELIDNLEKKEGE